MAHSNQIVTDLTGFARVSPPTLAPANLGEIINRTLSSIEIRGSVSIIRKFDSELPDVMVDAEQVQRRVFLNLATNAQDAMPDGGELTITTRKVDGFAEVVFSDTGTGIDEQTIINVFEPLFTTKTNGTGLGLPVCRQILSNHGGTIDVTSVSGEGSTFTVRLLIQHEEP